jgi:nucleoside-diphosphate-sugar epimerase
VKFAVTGANGFLGRAVVRTITGQGNESLPLVRTASGMANECVIGDLSDSQPNADALRGVEVVIHLAARTHVTRETSSDPLGAYRRVNVQGTRNLLATAAQAGARRFVYMSSVKAVGERTQAGAPFTPLTIPAPEDAYGITKLEAEQEVMSACERSGMAWTIIRPPLVYGPGVSANFARLIKLVAQGVPLPLRGVYNRRSIVYVDNLASATLAAAQAEAAENKLLMICDDTLSTAELVSGIAQQLARPARLFTVPIMVLRAARHVPVVSRIVGRLTDSLEIDAGSSMRLINWTPGTTTTKALHKTVAQWQLQGE